MGEAKRRRDNPDMARQFADHDRAQAWNDLSKMCADRSTAPQFIEYGDPQGCDVSAVTKETFCPIEIGSRGDLTPARAQAAADIFQKVAPRAGPGCIYLHISGYDQDPRSLWDIPDAAEYTMLFARLAGLNSIDDVPAALNITSITLFAACGCFGPNIKRCVHFAPKVTEQ
jgi:hypothetical protein